MTDFNKDLKEIHDKIEIEWGVVLAVAKACEKQSEKLLKEFEDLFNKAESINKELTPDNIIGDLK